MSWSELVQNLPWFFVISGERADLVPENAPL